MKIILFIILSFSFYSQSLINTNELLNDLQILSADDMKGRQADTKGNEKARLFILKRLKEIGSNKVIQIPFTFEQRRSKKTKNGVNILSKIKGSDYPNSYMIISAHYDHVGIGKAVKNDSIYNGADDNASGVASLFQMLTYYKTNPPKHSIIFAFWDAEEMGLQGAKAFIKNPTVPLKDIMINLNLDMVSRSNKNELYVCGTYHYPFIKTHLDPHIKNYPIKLTYGHDSPKLGHNDWTMQSDQGPFHAAKVPFLYFGVEDHSGYHKPSDNYDNVTKDFFKKSTESILKISILLDNVKTLKN